MNHALVRDIQSLNDKAATIRVDLANEGPAIIEELCESMSLREVARRTGLSPTYLSRVKNDSCVCSPGAFLKLAYLAKGDL